MKAGGGIRGRAQGNPASCKQPCSSPNCHVRWAFSSHAKQVGRRQGAPRHRFKPLPCQCNAGGRTKKMLYLQLCLPAPGRTAGRPCRFVLLCHKTSYVTSAKSLLRHQAHKRQSVKTDQTLQDRGCLALGCIQILNVPAPSPTNSGPFFQV